MTYHKNNNFNYNRRNKYATIGAWFLLLMAVLLFFGFLKSKEVDKKVVLPVKAEEKNEVIISCDTPKGYLECQVYKGVITWKDHDKLYRLVDECENRSWDTNATHINVHKNGRISTDRGIFMVNDYYHPKLSNQDAFDFKKNIDYAISLYKKQGVKPWACARILNIK